jgi:dissimilatory sulfite reductase (desulfoviridin) alpha/beta subunit
LVDTFALYERIENELGIRCANDLPHKFKIAISGCPNACTRAQATEIGIHGQVDPLTKASGYAVYLGGCGGKNPRPGFRLEKVYSAGEALELIGRVVSFFRQNAQPGQRLALLIEQMGREEFLRRLSL